MKNRIVSHLLPLVLVALSFAAFAADKQGESAGQDPGQTKNDQNFTRSKPINVAEMLTDFVDDKNPVYGLKNEVKQIDRGMRDNQLVILEGAPGAGKTSAKKAWFRSQPNVSLKVINFSKIATTRNSFERDTALQEIADYIRQLNINDPSRKTVLDIERLGDFGDSAKDLVEAIVRARIPAIIEANSEQSDLYIRKNAAVGSRAVFVAAGNIEKENLRAAVQTFIDQFKQQYLREKNLDITVSDSLADHIVQIVGKYLPDNQVKNARELLKESFYEFYSERYMNRSKLAAWRDELNRINSDLHYNGGNRKQDPTRFERLEERKGLLEGWIAEAKQLPDQLQTDLNEKQKELEALSGAYTKLTATKKWSFSLNFWSRSTKNSTGDQQITAQDLEKRIQELTVERDNLKAQLEATVRGQASRTLDETLVNQIAAEITSLPMKVFSADMEQLLTNIESRVETYGQDDAVRSGARQLRNVVRQTSRNGIAIVVNMGGAGTGKTSTGEALAREAGIPSLYVSMENYSDETKMNDIDNSGRGYVGSDRPESTLLGRIFKMPVLKMVLFDEWEKAYQEVAKKFVSAWDSGKMDWNGQPRSLKGTIFWITTNQGQMFPEYLAQALALHDQIKKNGTIDGLNLELPQALREKLKTGAPNVPAEELKTQLHALLTEMNMTEMQLNEIASAQGDYRDGLESAAAGRYLHHIDPVRWPKEILSRITVLFYKPHTEESISLVVEKFIRQFRKDMRNDLKVRVYVDDEAIEQLKKSYNKDTGARPIEISLRDLFSDVIYKTMPDIDLNADVIEIGVEGGRFVANKVNKSDMFKAMVAGMRNMKEIASETDLAKEDRKIRSGIVTRSVREALRSAR